MVYFEINGSVDPSQSSSQYVVLLAWPSACFPETLCSPWTSIFFFFFFFFFLAFPSYIYLWGSPLLGEIFAM